MTDEEYKQRKEFAKNMADSFTAKELAMILWKNECLFCFRRNSNPTCYGDCDCVSGILTKAQEDFKGKYDFYNGMEQTDASSN